MYDWQNKYMYNKIPMLLTLNLFIKLKTLINHAHKWFLKVCNGFEINIHIKMYFNGLNCSRVLSTSLRLRTSSITLYVPHILCTYSVHVGDETYLPACWLLSLGWYKLLPSCPPKRKSRPVFIGLSADTGWRLL